MWGSGVTTRTSEAGQGANRGSPAEEDRSLLEGGEGGGEWGGGGGDSYAGLVHGRRSNFPRCQDVVINDEIVCKEKTGRTTGNERGYEPG